MAKPTAKLGSAALWYVSIGVPVFPLHSGAKLPATQHGFKDATTDQRQIKSWWQSWPDANVGLATGHVFDVIDIDDWGELEADRGPIADRVREIIESDALGYVATPHGTHVYRTPTGDGNKARMCGGTDLRGRGGYVVAPPSVVEHQPYRWLEPPEALVRHAEGAAR